MCSGSFMQHRGLLNRELLERRCQGVQGELSRAPGQDTAAVWPREAAGSNAMRQRLQLQGQSLLL